MKIKLLHGLAGDRFDYKPNQVLKISEKTGASYIAAGSAVQVDEATAHDGEYFDNTPEEAVLPPKRRALETAAKAAPEAAVGAAGAPAHCASKTTKGNQCLKAPLPGKDRCAAHIEEL